MGKVETKGVSQDFEKDSANDISGNNGIKSNLGNSPVGEMKGNDDSKKKQEESYGSSMPSLPLVLLGGILFSIPLMVWALAYAVRGKKPFYDKENGLAKFFAIMFTLPVYVPMCIICKIKDYKKNKRFAKNNDTKEEETKEKSNANELTDEKHELERDVETEKNAQNDKLLIPKENINGEGREI